jgi:molybdate transport system regulatory protein
MPHLKQHKPSGKIWIEYQGKPVLGKGGAEILGEIDNKQSLSRAARKLGMSYRYLWGRVRKIQNTLDEDVVETYKGGKTGGGGARLTEVGRSLLDEYRRLERAFSDSLTCPRTREAKELKVGTGNQLKGEILALDEREATAKVSLKLEVPATVTIAVTKKVLKDLNLKVGDRVETIVESIEITKSN